MGTVAGAGGWVRRLGGALRPHAGLVGLALGGAVVAQLAAALAPLIQRHVVDQVIVPRRGGLVPWIALLVAASTGTAAAGPAWRSSTTCARPSSATCSGWTSLVTTSCRPARW